MERFKNTFWFTPCPNWTWIALHTIPLGNPVRGVFSPFYFGQESRTYWWVWIRRRQHHGSHECRGCHLFRGPWLGMYLTPQPSGVSRSSVPMFSSSLNLVNPHFLKMWIFWWPGSLNLAPRRASVICSFFCCLVRIDIIIWPTWTLTTVPFGRPLATEAFQRHWAYLSGTLTRDSMPVLKVLERAVSRIPLSNLLVQATGCIHYRGGSVCSLCTRPPWSA